MMERCYSSRSNAALAIEAARCAIEAGKLDEALAVLLLADKALDIHKSEVLERLSRIREARGSVYLPQRHVAAQVHEGSLS